MSHNKVGFASAAVAAAALFILVPPPAPAQEAGTLAGDDVVSLLVRLGVHDTAARDWDGSLEVSGGELLGLRDWRPAARQRGRRRRLEAGQLPGGRTSGPARSTIRRPSVRSSTSGRRDSSSTVRGNGGSRLMFATANGEFEVRLADVAVGRRLRFLGGDVTVERVPGVERMTSDDYQNDFATILGGDGDEVWAAWLGYRDNANEVLARRFDGQGWGEVQTLTEEPGDHFLVKMGRDGDGRPWVVYSAQVDGNWDLYARVLDGDAWSSAERLTEAPQPDVFHNLATDAEGNLWVVWQGFRDGAADIFARRHDGERWSGAEQVSSSPVNDWEPVIVADSKGGVYVGWDTYDAGNYDVLVRRWAGGEWGEEMPVASTAKYEAHISLAVDGQDRVWAAWNESGVNWGKDTGWVLNREGTRLYEWRTMNVAVHDGWEWRSPAADINEALPEELQDYNDFPVLFPGRGRTDLAPLPPPDHPPGRHPQRVPGPSGLLGGMEHDAPGRPLAPAPAHPDDALPAGCPLGSGVGRQRRCLGRLADGQPGLLGVPVRARRRLRREAAAPHDEGRAAEAGGPNRRRGCRPT